MRPLFCCFFLLSLFQLKGQNMRFSHLDQKQGLSQNTATVILQDREGFIWVGTQDGLNRYDGYSFEVFRTVSGDTNSLVDNFVLSLAEDNDGNIWIGTRNGICVYNRSGNHIYRYYSDPDERSQFHVNIRRLFSYKNGGVIYLGYRSKIISVSLSVHHNEASFTSAIIEDSIRNFSYDKETNRLALLKGEIILLKEAGSNIEQACAIKLSSHSIPMMLLAGDSLFISDSLGVSFTTASHPETQEHLFTSDVMISTLMLDPAGQLWCGTEDGLRIASLQTDEKKVVSVKERKGDFFSLNGERIESIYTSREGLIWVGTVGGVNIYDPLQKRFTVYQDVIGDQAQEGSVWFVLCIDDVLLWSGDHGLRYHTNGEEPAWLKLIPADHKYSAGFVDSKKCLWLGTKNEGLLIVDLVHNTIDRRFESDPRFDASSIMDLTEDQKGRMWIASIGSLAIIDSSSDVEFIARARQHMHGIINSYFTSISTGLNGTILVGSASGLYRFTSDTIYDLIKNDPLSENSLGYNIINDVFRDRNTLWIATMGSGLDRYDMTGNRFTHYTIANGLANGTIYGIAPDGSGHLWLSTNEGLISFDTITGNSKNYTMRDGLPSNEFVINKHAENANDGSICFGSSAGLVRFAPRSFNEIPSFTQPVIALLFINYKAIPVPAGDLLLGSDERNISIGFSVIDFRNQDKISYAYMLEGFDTAWYSPGQNRMAVYTNLPYGEYTFHVRYRISGEAWNEKQLNLHVIIATPFYATVWFRITALLLALGFIAFVVRFISQRKLRKQIEEMKVQQQIRNEKERISRDLHDTVGAQLTYVISSLDNLAYGLHRNKAEKESEKLEQLGEFARGTMEQLRESIWAINSEHISISELAGKWKQYFSQLGESDHSFNGKVSREGSDILLKPTVAIEIHRIVQEAINNAFKHSGGSLVEVNIRYSEGLFISVIDNGRGFESDVPKNGHFGLQNMKERAKLIDADFRIDSSENGTALHIEWKEK